jgi:hypothetical protein
VGKGNQKQPALGRGIGNLELGIGLLRRIPNLTLRQSSRLGMMKNIMRPPASFILQQLRLSKNDCVEDNMGVKIDLFELVSGLFN